MDYRCKPEPKPASGSRRSGPSIKPGPALPMAAPTAPSSAPCGACKFLRRKCAAGCVFAPYFGSDQGAARFAAVHKVFGASNASKLLQHVPVGRRQDAVVTLCYEAQARLSDPVYGCVSTILALQQQVASLQTELSIVQSHLINLRLAAVGALQGSQQQMQQNGGLQPAYSNTSSASNTVIDLSSFPSPGLDLADAALPSPGGLEPLQLLQPLQDDEEEESQNPVDFANGVFHQK